MTYVNKRGRVFMDRGDLKPERRRSEARLKTYPSAIDIRAWCDLVEDRRQHILELVQKGTEKCKGSIVPIEAIVNTLMAGKNADISCLKKCLMQLWDFLASTALSDEDRIKLEALKQKMDKVCTEVEKAKMMQHNKSSLCPASKRHDKEKQEVEDLIKMAQDESPDSYKIKTKGPARIVTKVKGLKPGFQVATGEGNSPGNVATRAVVRNAYPVRSSTGKRVSIDEQTPETNQSEPVKPKSDPKSESKNKGNAGSEKNYVTDSQPSDSHKSDLQDITRAKEKSNDFLEKLQKLQDELAAREALCNQQQISINTLQSERDDFKKKIEAYLREIDDLKRARNVDNPNIQSTCKEEIEALEQEMRIMRSGNLAPEQEAEIIKKEVDILKRYCLKLKSTEDENERLRIERDKLKSQVDLGEPGQEYEKGNSREMEVLTKERDELANKVLKLEQELLQYRDLPEDVNVYKDRSQMLNNALAERDNLLNRLEEMKNVEKEMEELKKKAQRADELEDMLRSYNKNDKNTSVELKKTRSKCCCLERELQNCKLEKDAMNTRIEYMKMEIDSLKTKAKESEMLRLERDRLQIKLNELSHVQVHNENLMLKCKCLENAAMERDAYKKKYEDVISMECQCEMIRAQAEEAKNVARERDSLMKQVGDLESCIHEQEDEIKRCMCQIDSMMKNKDETQARMKEALSNMRAEVEKKDCLIAASEEKLASVQAQLKSSIQGVSCETTCYKTRIEELERELCHSHCEINSLKKQLRDKDGSIKGAKKLTRTEVDTVAVMKKELDAARAENKKLQEIANKMVTITGDEHVQKMLKQSECAVRRVVEELGKQYREWDNMRHKNLKTKFSNRSCPCNVNNLEDHGLSDTESNDKLREELEDIQREKDKLENLVKQIQNDKFIEGPTKEIVALRMENSKLQDQLRKEVEARKNLELKLNKI